MTDWIKILTLFQSYVEFTLWYVLNFRPVSQQVGRDLILDCKHSILGNILGAIGGGGSTKMSRQIFD